MIAFFAVNNNAKAQCQEEGNCDPPYWSNNITYTFTYPMFPNCPLTAYYQTMNCDGKTYVRLSTISFPVDPQCNALMAWLIPNGLGTYAEAVNYFVLWREALNGIVKEQFEIIHDENPLLYNCPETYPIISITGGGCNSVWTYYRPAAITHPVSLVWVRHVPCEPDGCCVTTKNMCWFNGVVIQLSESTQYVSTEDCTTLQPLYNPFEGFGPEWVDWGHTPCAASCYMEN